MDPDTELAVAPGHQVGAGSHRERDSTDASHDDTRVSIKIGEKEDIVPKSTDIDDAREACVRQKGDEIRTACRWRDLVALRSLAESEGGFLTDTLRQIAWPILLGLSTPEREQGDGDKESREPRADTPDWRDLPPHIDEGQVQLDVNRSFIYYPHGQSDADLEKRKSELSVLILEVLRRYPYLCYFQGYHDICQVFLLVLQPSWRARAVARLSVLRIRDFMLPNLGPTTAQLRLIPDILSKADPELRRHVAGVEPFYALAGTLTMYAHNIEGYHDIARLFDVFLTREPVFSIYMFAQIVIDRREEVFEIDELDMLQVVLGKVPPQMDLEGLIARSTGLFERFPPQILRSWDHISSASALKTARDAHVCETQTMEEGHNYFQQQAKELRWAEVRDRVKMALWAYRRPARTMGVAVAVAIVAFYLRRNPSTMHRVIAFFNR